MTFGINVNTLRAQYFTEPENKVKHSLGDKVVLSFVFTTCSLVGLVALPLFGSIYVIITTPRYIKVRYSAPDTSLIPDENEKKITKLIFELKKEYYWSNLTFSIKMAIPLYGLVCIIQTLTKNQHGLKPSESLVQKYNQCISDVSSPTLIRLIKLTWINELPELLKEP